MRSLFAIGAAVAVTAVFALPAPAVAAEKRADGVRNVEQMDVSSQRRYRHKVSRYGAAIIGMGITGLSFVLPLRRTTLMACPTTGHTTARV